MILLKLPLSLASGVRSPHLDSELDTTGGIDEGTKSLFLPVAIWELEACASNRSKV